MLSEGRPAPERRLHPLTVAFAAGRVARALVFPAVLGGVSVGEGEIDRIVAVVLLAIAVPAVGYAASRWAFFRYALSADELVIRSGLVFRTHRVIPLARVQNVDARQGVLQRLFRVAELRVETAGGRGQAEAVFTVLGAAEAQALRTELLARRRAPDAAPASAEEEAAAPVSSGRLLKRLTTGDVVLAGATGNEAGVIAAGAAGALQLADEVNLPLLERVGDSVDWLARTAGGGAAVLAVLAVALVFALLFVGWAISVTGAVVRYHGFTLRRENGELRKRYGLLTVHEGSLPLARVQAVRVEESPLRRPLGLAALMIETAGAAPWQEGAARGGAEAFVPLAHRGEVAALVRGIFDDLDYDAAPLQPVHPRALRRIAVRNALLLLPPAAVLAQVAWLAGEPLWLLWLLPLAALAWWLARVEYANRGYALAGGYVLARGGVLTRVTWIVPEGKLQTLHLTESPFQRRRGLASLVVDTAAGGRQAVVADLGAARAREVLEELAERIRAAARARRRGSGLFASGPLTRGGAP